VLQREDDLNEIVQVCRLSVSVSVSLSLVIKQIEAKD
jgi:hypothetical protein